MKSHMHREHAKGARIRVGSFLAPNILQPLGSDERRYLVWGILRLILGVFQMSFAVTALLCLIFVGLSSSATLTCALIATIAALASRALFHGQSGTRR
jgi:hypothetical protein